TVPTIVPLSACDHNRQEQTTKAAATGNLMLKIVQLESIRIDPMPEENPVSSVPRRYFIGSVAGAAATSFAQPRPHRPNILYIHPHDSGRSLVPYGHAVPAPNLQRLADQGVVFRKAFNAAPTCSPSRARLLTGMCPHNNGMFGLAHRGFVLNDYKQHMLHTLRPAGYYSALFGIQHIARDPATIGYDLTQMYQGSRGEAVSAGAAEFLRKAPKTPFFLDVGFFETHRPFRKAGAKDDARFCLPPAPIPDTPQTRQDIAEFKAS